MKSKMTIGKQLLLVTGALVALVLVLSYASLSAIGSLEDSFNEVAGKTHQKTVLADEINTAESDMLAGQRGYLLYAFMKDAGMMESSKKVFLSNAEKIRQCSRDFRPLVVTQEGYQILDRIDSGVNTWSGEVWSAMERNVQAGHPEIATQIAKQQSLPIYRELGDAASRLTRIQVERLAANRTAAAELATGSRWIESMLIVVSLLVSCVSIWVVRRVNRALKGLAMELGEGAEQLASAAAQVSASSQSLAQGSSEQAASLEETSASSEEISSMTQKNSDNSARAAQNMVEAARRIDGANESLNEMIASMNEINASSDKISRIIKVIDEIAFQTNILALNAAVEAARAGDAGAGFAVVADEVRNLAQRCAQAARDTSGLIAESIEKSNEGKQRLARVTADVQAITESASSAKTLVEEVNLASREQAQGIGEIARAISQMQQVTQNAAASAEESASAGEELSAQSAKLKSMVHSLTELVGSR